MDKVNPQSIIIRVRDKHDVHILIGECRLTFAELIAINGNSLLKGPKDLLNPVSASQDKNISKWRSLLIYREHSQKLSRHSNISKQHR